MLSEEATHTNFIVFGLTRPGLEPTIYRTRGEHATHYTTAAVTIGEHLNSPPVFGGVRAWIRVANRTSFYSVLGPLSWKHEGFETFTLSPQTFYAEIIPDITTRKRERKDTY
jgi:hypothetical protein